MARTLDLYQLMSQPESFRDHDWEKAFLQAFTEANVQVVSEGAKNGPDGWPYLLVKTSVDGKEPVAKVIGWLSERGIGLAVNSHKMMPDYIFSYGMLWNFRERGQFQTPSDHKDGEQVVYDKGEKWIFGPPTESYLPLYVRQILREFFAAQKINEPKLLVASSSDFTKIDLLLSLDSIGNPPAGDHRKIAEAVGWFLPTHYSLVLAQEEGMPKFHLI
jgi:hypothetical protein